MPRNTTSLRTSADELYDLVIQSKEISMKDAAKKLGVPLATIEAWATFLEEDGNLAVKYKFTTPYLIIPAKKQSDSIAKSSFQKKIAEAELKADMETATKYLESAAAHHKQGEFGILAQNYQNLVTKIKGIIDHIVSTRKYLTPQIKTELVQGLEQLQRDTNKGSGLIKENKYNEANALYNDLHTSTKKLLQKATNYYKETVEAKSADEQGIKQLIEKTYRLLETGKLEEAQSNFNQIHSLYDTFSKHIVSEKSVLQDGLVKLNKDMGVHATRIKKTRMAEGTGKITLLIRSANTNLSRGKYALAGSYYEEIKKVYADLPTEFASERRKLKGEILRIYEKIANQREAKMQDHFKVLSHKIEGIVAEAEKNIVENNLGQAHLNYIAAQKLYRSLPNGFMKDKFSLQSRMIMLYKNLASRVEVKTESDMESKSTALLRLIETMRKHIDSNQLSQADQTYHEIGTMFGQLPKGFIAKKTKLQEKIIDAYEQLLSKRDRRSDNSFKSDAQGISKDIEDAQKLISEGNFTDAHSMYVKIKQRYSSMKAIDINQRLAIRNSILALYRDIIKNNPVDPLNSIDTKIDGLKTMSRAQVRLPLH